MLDIHPPHAAAHSWRDILIHLATITVGLFIALSLESMIEGIHHRHIVREARENIRHEIEVNKSKVEKNEISVQSNADNMKGNIDKARALRDKSGKIEPMRFSFTWDSFDDSAWRAARDSGALGLMPIGEVQSYADAYGEQDIVNRAAVTIFTNETDGVAPTLMEKNPQDIRPEDVHELMRDCALSLIHLTTLKQLIHQLGKNYADVLPK